MTLRNLLVADRVLNLFRKVEQADQVRNGGAVEAESTGELLLSPPVVVQVVAEGDRLFKRVQILALKVLDHGELADPLVVELHHSGRDLMKLGFDARPQPTFARDELVAV